MPPACTPSDDDGRAKDRYSDGCKAYEEKPFQCGAFDIPGFNSMEMCCACGGGARVSPPLPPPHVPNYVASPPVPPPSSPPISPGHMLLKDGEDLSIMFANNPELQVLVLEPEQTYTVSTPINVSSQSVTITLSYLPSASSKRAKIEVDTDVAFASIGAGGSLSLSGVDVERSAASQGRRRRLNTDDALVDNNGGSLHIVDSALSSENSVAVNSNNGDLNITGSTISGKVTAAKGSVVLEDSSFADSLPMVTVSQETALLVGTGNSFNFSDQRSMDAIVQSDSTSTTTYVCESSGSCQLSTAAAADVQDGVCRAGSAATGGGGACELCEPGTYTDQDDQAQCLPCAGGTYQDDAGQTECKECTLGHACPPQSSSPVECAPGSYSDRKNLRECKDCEPGRYCAAGSFKGLLCERGNYCPPQSVNMVKCPAGTYGSTTGLTNASCSGPCEPGHFCELESTTATSTPCPAGTYSEIHGLTNESGCAECPAGTECPRGSAVAAPCSPGTVAPNASTAACVKCAPGTYQAEAGQQNCTTCPAGSFCGEGATAPSRCPGGYYSSKEGESDNTTACQPCERGSACATGSEEQTQCQPGTVQNNSAQVECVSCPAGTFQSGRGKFECEICTLGGYCTKGAAAPSPCMAGKFGNVTGGTKLYDCYDCTPGHSCPLGAVEPVPCTPGKFASQERYDTAVSLGGTAFEGLAQCDGCPAGKYQDEEGQLACKPCKLGSYCPAGASVPSLCPAGYYGDGGEDVEGILKGQPLVNETQCKNCSKGMRCPAGSYCSDPNYDPTTYPGDGSKSPGEYQCLTGAKGQSKCPAGTYTNNALPEPKDRHVCIDCVAGKYQDSIQQTDCKPCKPGHFCLNASAAARPCPMGTYYDLEGAASEAECKQTDPGYYAKTGSSNQTACSPGTVQGDNKKNSCVSCPAGKYMDEPAGTECKPCEPGYYCKAGASVALPCKAGTYTTATNLTSADECTNTSAGHYAAAGSEEQTKCGPGTVQPEEGMGACDECEAGKFQEEDGMTACDACNEGFYCETGASAALPCKAGTYSNRTDLTEDDCTPTERGYYASTGTTRQVVCSPGTVAPNTSMGTCAKCEGGKFQPGFGEEECLPCTEGYYCPEGANAPLPCQEGTYSTALDRDGDGRPCTNTTPGYYAPTGSTAQLPCSPGTYADEEGMGTCKKCPGGTFQKFSNASKCDLCKPGYYCPEGAAAALPCREGTHSDATNNPSEANCSPTDSGFEASTGSHRQTKCPLGRYDPILKGETDDPDLEQCELCPKGTYADETGMVLECKVCPKYNWCGKGSSAPTPCDAGKVGNGTGLGKANECESCPPGHWCSAGIAIPCPKNTYNTLTDQNNQGACKPCPENAESEEGSESELDCVCRAGYYSINRDASEAVRCAECPIGTTCATSGLTIVTLQSAIDPGHYRRTNLSAEIRRCPDYRQNKTLDDGRDRSSCSPSGEEVSELGCRLGTTGAFCSQCDVTDGTRFFSHSTSSCKECTGNIGTPAGNVIVIVLLSLLLALLGFMVKFKPHERYPWFQMGVTRVIDLSASTGFRAKFKQVMGFYQIATRIQVVYQVNMPDDTQSFLDFLQDKVNLDLVQFFGYPLECGNLGGYENKLRFMIIWPIVVCVLLLAVGVSMQWVGYARNKVQEQVKAANAAAIAKGARPSLARERRSLSVKDTAHDHSSLWKSSKRGVLMALPAVSIVTFLAFPMVSSTAFRVWARVEFETDTKYDSDNAPLPRSEPDVVSYMIEDPGIRYGSPEHESAVSLAVLAIFLYPVGIPALYLLLLFCARGAILRDRPTRLSSALSFLHRDFEARMYGWEIAEQFKKLFLVGFMTLVRPDTIVQLGVAIIFCLVFMLGAAIAKPYRREENDYFAVACNFALTAVFVFCTMLKVKTVSETMDPGELFDRLNFDEVVIGALMTVCVFGALVLAALLSVQSIIEAAQVPTFRLLTTGNRPELALAKGHKWHLFLSHIWGTGQDQCATIKRQLSLLLTGVSVFLDVDDLEDIGALEEYIEKTGLIMIFVSKGYFKSKNCLREVKATLHMRKPTSLMHDPVRGGAPLKTIQDDECPPEYFTDIFKDFGKDRNVIIFHRIKDFQVVSIKLLAQDVLLSSPNFARKSLRSKRGEGATQDTSDVQLALPDELTRRHLSFERPITVYVSLHNPGAAVAMEALQDGFIKQQEPKKKLPITGMPPMTLVTVESRQKQLEAAADDDLGEESERGGRRGSSLGGEKPDKAASAAAAKRAKAARGQIRATAIPPKSVKMPEAGALFGEDALKNKAKANEPTHMMLYLNKDTFVGDKGELFADEVRAARANGFPIIMVHENDEAAGGCEFARFFESTPQDLIADGLYKALAYAWYPEPFLQVSVALVALAFGAEEPHSTKLAKQAKRLGKRWKRDCCVSWAACLALPIFNLCCKPDAPKAAKHKPATCVPAAAATATATQDEASRTAALPSKTVELVATPLGLGLTADREFKVVALAKDGQAKRSKSIAVGDQLVSLNGEPLVGGVSFEQQLGAIPVGTKVRLGVSKPAGRSGRLSRALHRKSSRKSSSDALDTTAPAFGERWGDGTRTQDVVLVDEQGDDAPDGGWL